MKRLGSGARHMCMSRLVAALTIAGAVLATACSTPPPSTSAQPVATPDAHVAPSSPAAHAASVSADHFSATVVHDPGARIRYGAGLDMPVMDILPVGRSEVFDGWFQRTDDQPLPDEVTGKIESWSRDWLHLASGRGWVHSSAVKGAPPAGMAQMQWLHPDSLPSANAGLIEVSAHMQEHPVTCEVASLLMALDARGIRADELALLRLTGVDSQPVEENAAGDIQRWGDPNQAFVGNPEGHISLHTGYGVYSGPIATAAERSGVTVLTAGTGVKPSAVYAAVLAGHPAITWVSNDYRTTTTRTWEAWDGATIPYTLNEHAVLVVGVTPASVLINDPLKGQIWRSRSDFEAGYATFSNMAVIVN